MFEREKKDGCVLLRIKGAMSVFTIEKTHQEIAASFGACDDLTLDLKGVNDCDISGLQLLYSARKTARSIGKAFSVEGASNSIIDIFSRAGQDPEIVFEKEQKFKTQNNGKEISNGQCHHDGG